MRKLVIYMFSLMWALSVSAGRGCFTNKVFVSTAGEHYTMKLWITSESTRQATQAVYFCLQCTNSHTYTDTCPLEEYPEVGEVVAAIRYADGTLDLLTLTDTRHASVRTEEKVLTPSTLTKSKTFRNWSEKTGRHSYRYHTTLMMGIDETVARNLREKAIESIRFTRLKDSVEFIYKDDVAQMQKMQRSLVRDLSKAF